eukprot:scaffold3473_cov122-Isochrysis_galbana.AAC.14
MAGHLGQVLAGMVRADDVDGLIRHGHLAAPKASKPRIHTRSSGHGLTGCRCCETEISITTASVMPGRSSGGRPGLRSSWWSTSSLRTWARGGTGAGVRVCVSEWRCQRGGGIGHGETLAGWAALKGRRAQAPHVIGRRAGKVRAGSDGRWRAWTRKEWHSYERRRKGRMMTEVVRGARGRGRGRRGK